MELINDTVRFTIDGQNNNKSKEIKDYLLNENKEVKKIMYSYLITIFLTEIQEYDLVEEYLTMLNRVMEKFNPEEVEEIASIYNNKLEDYKLDNMEPMTIGRLIRFKNRSMLDIFLYWMEIDEEEFINLNDNELADFILMKFQDEEFKELAERHFKIKNTMKVD